MLESQSSRKLEILNVAQEEYIQNGSAGVRLQVIADKVGVTKAMIHYYFDTKENLFRQVFKITCEAVFGNLMHILEKKGSLFLIIDEFIRLIVERIHKYPDAAAFVITELNQQPAITLDLFTNSVSFDASLFSRQLNEAASNYEIARVDSNQVLANIFSLCLFPYSGNRFIKEFLNIEDEQEYNRFLEQRSIVISDAVINWLAS